MKCTKCNHALPDDSEFCQYCGTRLEKTAAMPEMDAAMVADGVAEPDVPVKNDVEAKVSAEAPKQSADETWEPRRGFDEQETIGTTNANVQRQPDRKNDEDFGLVPENPVYTSALEYAAGQHEYLNRLYTVNGEKIRWTRKGSTNASGVGGMIDIYDTFLPSGQFYKTVYMNMYGAKASQKAPQGFVCMDTGVPPKARAAQKVKQPKKKYCSRCGALIDAQSKQCTGCGKQYFKGMKVNWCAVTITLLTLVIAALIGLNVFQYLNTSRINEDLQQKDISIENLEAENENLEKKNKDLEGKVSDLKTELHDQRLALSNGDEAIERLEAEISEYKPIVEFSKDHVEIIGNDSTKYYHKLGCNYLDMTQGFLVFNTEAARAQGFKQCPYCRYGQEW